MREDRRLDNKDDGWNILVFKEPPVMYAPVKELLDETQNPGSQSNTSETD